jgi:putative DNA primase/helicase
LTPVLVTTSGQQAASVEANFYRLAPSAYVDGLGDLQMTLTQQRPKPLTIQADNVPQELKGYQQFVCWNYQPRGEGWTKVPVQPNGEPASSTDPQTWRTFDECLEAYHAGRCDGVGFVTSENDPFVLIDLDHVMPSDGPMVPWANEIVRASINEDCYVEISVGGDGIHIIGRGPQGFRGRKANQIEIYSSGRFFTITGCIP